MGRTRALRNVKEVELKDIPKLTKCSLVTSFKCVKSVKMENVSKLGEVKVLKQEWEKRKEEERLKEEEERLKEEEEERLRKEREEEERRKEEAEEKKRKEEERKRRERERKKQEEEKRIRERERKKREEEERKRKEAEEAAKKTAVISCKRDWDCINRYVSTIEVSNGCCNAEGLKELDLSGFVNLRELKVGNECFSYVEEVKLIGLSELERACIGSESFRRDGDIKGGSFYLKDCPKLRSLRITGVHSFSNYSVIVIENVNALEEIEIGELNQLSYSFPYASLELKSVLILDE